MIVVDNIELSKNPVSTGETFIIRVTAREVFATWDDVKQNTWQHYMSKTWDMVKRLIF